MDGKKMKILMALAACAVFLFGCASQPPADTGMEETKNETPGVPMENVSGGQTSGDSETEGGAGAVEEAGEETGWVPDIVGEYDPEIDPADFTTNINNSFFMLVPGTKWVYEADTSDGTERIEVYVTNQTKKVMGVETRVVWDRVWLDGELIEDTYDWYAQDKDGNVWYFGEDTAELDGGEVITTAGSWEAGVDNAKPGVVMPGEPEVGQAYRQEFYAGEAEDMAEVLALNETVSVPSGNYSGCLKTHDWTPLEANVDEHKFYCPDVGGFALEIVLEDGERVELMSVEYGAEPTPAEEPAPAEEPDEDIENLTEDEAKALALGRIPGVVTGIETEWRNDRLVYVVEIDADDGPETDVFIDVETGEVVAIET
ncbi:MAG: PepSY domain-containing protein [Candidatus Micrarchaeota archaeon]